jgi:hypothetical protein
VRSPALTLLILVVASAGPAMGQTSGRWWWEARARLEGQNNETRIDDGPWNSNRAQNVRVNVGINGFIAHPLIVSFGVDLDVLYSRLKGADDSNNSSFGGGAAFDLFPTSSVPSGFRIRRILYDYSRSDDSPLTNRGFPGVTTQWDGWMRMRSGPLRGGIFTFDHVDTEAIDPQFGRDIYERQRFDLSRRTRSASHAVTLQRRWNEFGGVDYSSEELTLRVVERGNIGKDWTWSATGTGIRRELTDRALTDTVEDYDADSRFTGWLSPRQRLDLLLNLEAARFEDFDRLSGQTLGASYRRLLNRGWELGPFTDYLRRTFGDEESSGGRLGMTVLWNSKGGSKVDVSMRADGSVRRLRAEDEDDSTSEEQSAYGLGVVLTSGNPSGLRKELQVRADFNDLRQRNPIFELPDLGLSGRGLTSKDVYIAELYLDHAWDSSKLRSDTEWVRTKNTDPRLPQLESERFSSGLQLDLRKIDLRADVGTGETTQGDTDDQRVHFAGAEARWSPTYYLGVRGRYRVNQRDVNFGPDIDFVEYRLGVEVPLRQMRIEVYFEQFRRSVEDGPVTMTRALRWNISSSFAGWLPWETGTRRRGVIR